MDHNVVPMSASVIAAASAGSLAICGLLLLPVRAFLASYTDALDPRLVHRPTWVTLPALAPTMILATSLATWAAMTTPWPHACPSPAVAAALAVLEACVAGLLAAAACCDLACHRLPNRLLLPAGLLAAAHTLTAAWFLGTPLYPWWLAALAGAVLYGLAGLRGIGLGDVKLVVVTLTWLVPLGWEADANGLVWALVTAGAVAGGGRLSGRLSRGQTLALGPYLVAGALAARLAAAF